MPGRIHLVLLALLIAASGADAGQRASKPQQAQKTKLKKQKEQRQRATKTKRANHAKRTLRAQLQRDRRAREKRIARQTNQRLAKKYPTLSMVLRRPEHFVKDLQARFQAQKAATPNAPYSFDYSELGVPVAKDMVSGLQEKIADITADAAALRKRMGLNPGTPPSRARRALSKLSGREARLREYEVALKYYKRLHTEASRLLRSGRVTYQQAYELSYFYSRAIGHFDARKLSLIDRLMLPIDRHLQGYKQLSIEREFELYKQRKFQVFQLGSPVGGFKEVAESFESAFHSTDKLETVIVPTTAELGTDVFMRLLSHDIYLIGVTNKPIRADGFVRPGGDFWMHDIRHSSSIFGRRKAYEKEHALSKGTIRKLHARMDVWQHDLNEALKQVPDKKTRAAIQMMAFNYHHDRGYPLAPSSYLKKRIGAVPYLLYLTLSISGQRAEFARFDKPLTRMREAHKWLRTFMLKRLPEEEALLGRTFQVEK